MPPLGLFPWLQNRQTGRNGRQCLALAMPSALATWARPGDWLSFGEIKLLRGPAGVTRCWPSPGTALWVETATRRGQCKHTHLGEIHSPYKMISAESGSDGAGFCSTQKAGAGDGVIQPKQSHAVQGLGMQGTVDTGGGEGCGLWGGVGRASHASTSPCARLLISDALPSLKEAWAPWSS